MSNRVRYYITENDDRAIVRSVPVKVSTQPANDLMVFEKQAEPRNTRETITRLPIGRVVKVLRKPHHAAQS